MTGRTIGSITALQRGNSYKSTLLGDEGPKLLGLGSIQKDGGFKDSALKSYSGPTDPRHLLRPGDIYVSLKDVTQSGDLLGSIARVPAHIELGRLTQDTVKLEFVDAEFSRSYVYWALRTPQYRSYCRARALGTTNLSLSRDDFLSFELPPLTSFRSTIVEVLEKIEEKIELNRRMAATLEEMARALYRSWFVDFDPVKAKAEGLAPAFMDEATAALFPDRFGDDGLPEGWQATTIGDVAEIVGGATPSTKNPQYWDEGVHAWATPRDLAGLSDTFLIETSRQITDQGLRKIGSGLSPAGSMLLSSRAPIGYRAIARTPVAVNQGFIVIRETATITGIEAYLWCEVNMDAILSNANGSTFQEISKKNFRPIPYVLADEPVRRAFKDMAKSMFERLAMLTEENRNLAALRDTLLPKLMSGELRVGEARDQIEEVA
jgi:type I restriction enzyme S subunit